MMALGFSLRALRREWRAGELRVLAAALVIAVTSMTSVGFFTDRVQGAMEARAAELLAADNVVASTRPAPEDWERQARRLGLATARYANFPSVVLHGDRPQLVDVKAVSDGYPLRGRVRVTDRPYGPETDIDGIPAPGKLWADARLMGILGLQTGDHLMLGTQRFTVSRVIAYEPDRGGDLIAFAPRLLMNHADLASTRLLGPGSRASYRLLLAGSAEALAAYRAWLEPRLTEGERLIGVRDARPELKVALDRAGRFLGLAALVSVVLAGVAVATAAQRYSARHLDAAAVMRCLGADQSFLSRLHAYKMLWLGLAASLAGCVLGYAAQEVLARLGRDVFAVQLPAPSFRPMGIGIATGLILLLGFALPALIRLKDVPPVRVLRHDLGMPPVRMLSAYGAALAAITALLLWQSSDVKLTALVLAGAAVTLVALGLVALGLVRVLNRLRGRVGIAWRYGFANIARRARSSVTQILAFGLGIMVLLLLSIVRADLLQAWKQQLPADAPNQFVINIQPSQVGPLQDFFTTHGLHGASLHAMVRARLIGINGHRVSPEDYAEDRTRRLVEREFNMSWADRLQDDNRVVAGRWWRGRDRGMPRVSVEKGLADRLKLKLGDVLDWRIADREIRLTIDSIRTVEWDTFRANFFVLTPPGVLDDYPATYMTSFHLRADQRDTLAQLVRQFPNVTMIDVEAIMRQVRDIMDRVNLSIEYVFLFTLLAGLTVLYSAIQSTQDERLYDSALLRTLGASRRHVLKGLLAEFGALGLLAGLLASFAASLAGLVLARQVFELNYLVNPWVWVAGLAGGTAGVGLFGILGARFVLNRPPLATLRAL